jgi:hypothetical protein
VTKIKYTKEVDVHIKTIKSVVRWYPTKSFNPPPSKGAIILPIPKVMFQSTDEISMIRCEVTKFGIFSRCSISIASTNVGIVGMLTNGNKKPTSKNEINIGVVEAGKPSMWLGPCKSKDKTTATLPNCTINLLSKC